MAVYSVECGLYIDVCNDSTMQCALRSCPYNMTSVTEFGNRMMCGKHQHYPCNRTCAYNIELCTLTVASRSSCSSSSKNNSIEPRFSRPLS